VVISLVYLATGNFRSRRLVRAGLIVGALILAGSSFLIHYNSHATVAKWRWMSLWVRDIDFSAAVLDLGLWALLIGARHKDTRLLLLSGGLGIQFAGEAIGQSLRYLFPWPLSPGDLVDMITNLAGLWIWWQALRVAPLPRHASVSVPSPRDEPGAAD
jgi:hypothetical protein